MSGSLNMATHAISNTGTITPAVTATSALGSSSKRFLATYTDQLIGPSQTSGLFSPTVDNTDDLGTTIKRYKTVYAASTTISALTGPVVTTGLLSPNVDNTDDLGTTIKRYKALYAANTTTSELTGPVVTTGLLSPNVDDTDDLGTTLKRYKHVYTTAVNTDQVLVLGSPPALQKYMQLDAGDPVAVNGVATSLLINAPYSGGLTFADPLPIGTSLKTTGFIYVNAIQALNTAIVELTLNGAPLYAHTLTGPLINTFYRFQYDTLIKNGNADTGIVFLENGTSPVFGYQAVGITNATVNVLDWKVTFTAGPDGNSVVGDRFCVGYSGAQ